MSKYTFTFKKGDIIVDFSSTDKSVIEKQFQIWVNAADVYAKSHLANEKDLKPKVAPEQKQEQKPEIPFMQAPDIEPSIEEQINEISEPAQTDEQVFDKASSLLKTINTIQQEESEQEVEKEETQETPSFDEILEQKVEEPAFEPQKTTDKVFLNLVNSKNTTDKFHYLMITAYYLSEFEKLEQFSLKQINAKLMQNLATVIDHSLLQEAINQSFIELVPDLTGTSEVGEYRLTREGEEFFASRI